MDIGTRCGVQILSNDLTNIPKSALKQKSFTVNPRDMSVNIYNQKECYPSGLGRKTGEKNENAGYSMVMLIQSMFGVDKLIMSIMMPTMYLHS